MRCWLFLLLLCSLSASPLAREKLPAVALSGVLGSKVILNIDGQRHILADGDSVAGNIRLISHDHESAQIKVGDQTITIKLGAAPVASSYRERAAGQSVKIYKDNYGMYRTVGLINGRVTNFLVDTGATTIAMSTRKAKSLGIDFIKLSKGKKFPVGTANGTAYAYGVTLDSVSVGGIEAKFVRAAIIEGNATDDILLGMSYLSRINVSQEQGVMNFTTK